MPKRFPTQEQIEAKRSGLLEKIAIGKRAEHDLAKLEESIKAVETLVDIVNDDYTGDLEADLNRKIQEVTNAAISEINTPLAVLAGRPKRVFNPLAQFAEAAIRKYGAHHIDDLMANMTQLGWQATDDYKLNMKNVFNSLSVNKKFTNLGRNVWDLTENVKKN